MSGYNNQFRFVCSTHGCNCRVTHPNGKCSKHNKTQDSWVAPERLDALLRKRWGGPEPSRR